MGSWIIATLEASGYWGVAFLMLLENIFPPIPSELIMPYAGFAAAQGKLGIVGVIVAGTIGSLLGVLPWYWAARALGRERFHRFAERHGRWLTLSGKDVDRATAWFDRHSGRAVLFGRLVPTVRTLISAPAGVARMSFGLFLIYSAIGTGLWTTFLTGAGYLLESQYRRVADYVDPIATAIFVGLILLYLYRLVSYRPASS